MGFSVQDSTTQQTFVEGGQVTVRVDLNQAATPTYPVIGHFHNLERALQLDTTSVDGSQVDVALAPGGIVHVAWLAHEQPASMVTPVYFVRYARSNDDGATFSTPVSVSGSLRFDLLTADGNGNSFSTLDLEVDSRGNPRVVYAMNHSPDGKTGKFAGNPDNIYLNYSETGGASWLPGDRSVLVNDTLTVGNVEGRTTAFPRMAIDERDNVYISYVRGASRGGPGADDVMLAQVNRQQSPFTMEAVGSLGTVGSAGGVRITPDTERQTGPDLAIGRGDVLHVLYFHEDAVPANSDFEHKTLLADDWSDVSSSGWNATVHGADVDRFDPDATTNTTLDRDAIFVFPTVVVDTVSSPDRIYALYKYADTSPIETVFYNRYTYDHAVGASAAWSTATAQAVWSTASSSVFSPGNLAYNIEQDWTVVDRISAVVDDRRSDRGELHIAFTAGYSNAALGVAGEHDLYYGFFNGQSWTLPEKVADDDAGTADGVATSDVFLSRPTLVRRAGESNVYLGFSGGKAEGLGAGGSSDSDGHPYFKVLGRRVSSEDQSRPVGGFQYDISYTPVNPHDVSSSLTNNAVYVHVADNLSGEGLGATGKKGDGFLAGDWENVGTSLQDQDKYFEGRVNEDATSDHEWGDNNDKTGLLLKLNVLGSDSSTNLQVIASSTAADGGAGARTVRIGLAPPVSLAIGDFFVLGARIDIVDANTSPTVSLSQPDGVTDSANTSFPIRYSLSDPDDDFTPSGLEAALYFSESGGLASVQDIRIFGTLIADQNDNTAVNAAGTDDFTEGNNQTYSWDDPPLALKNLLFASILQAPSASYYIYLVADDGKNPPVFVRSSGTVTVRHKPIVLQVDPTARDTVDTGVRSGSRANPYDLDFAIRDYDNQGSSQVALFYSAVSGLASVSVSGTYPTQKFVLGKSVAGARAIFIEDSDTLTSAHTQFSWDTTDSVFVKGDSAAVEAGNYYVYVVVSDASDIVVGQSGGQISVRHSPSFVFYEPPKDTHRRLNSGSQPVYSIQWQKGPGDTDFDDDANIDLYFTTDNPVNLNYEDKPDSLLKDNDTRPLVKGLQEDGTTDMYVWDFRSPPEEVPMSGKQVWIYAVITDGDGNTHVELGGSLTVTHTPFVNLTTSALGVGALPTFDQNDVLRIAWQDYLVDDGTGTEDAYLRVYASDVGPFATINAVDAAVDGVNTFLINSSDGTLGGTIEAIRESGDDFLDWNAKKFSVAGTYDVYVATSADATFSNNTAGGTQLSRSSTPLVLAGAVLSGSNLSLSPTDQAVAIGDTLTFDVMVHHTKPINLVQVVLTINTTDFLVRDQDTATSGTQPFVDLGKVFDSSAPIENQYRAAANQLRFAKSTFTGQVVGTTQEPAQLARFQLIARNSLQATPALAFTGGATGTVLGEVGQSTPLNSDGTLTLKSPTLTRLRRGQIAATVELEGRTIPPAAGDYSGLLDVHLRLPGSTTDLLDEYFRTANDDDGATTDVIEVQVAATGAMTLVSVPAGRYVMTVKDTSHVSGRTDTITVRNGELVTVSGSTGFYGSDLRGDPTVLLPSTGRQLIAGDVSEDNEINEDDVNLIIAAWGVNTAAANFRQADINNDLTVGAADLTVTTSNFGNSQGFGAPPVFKSTGASGRAGARNDQAALELRSISARPDRAVAPGEIIGVEIRGRDLQDLAGYEFRLDLDEQRLRPLIQRAEKGDVFAANPYGSVFDVRLENGTVHVLGSRIGKSWSAAGEGTLAKLWFEVIDVGAEESLRLGDGVLLNTGYQPDQVSWSNSLYDLLLPQQPTLDTNYPNPFNPTTVIPFALPGASGNVNLHIYNLLGQRVRSLVAGPMPAGFHTIVWNGRDDAGRSMAAGMYISELRTSEFRQTRKMTLVK